jgi:hypothetical protein
MQLVVGRNYSRICQNFNAAEKIKTLPTRRIDAACRQGHSGEGSAGRHGIYPVKANFCGRELNSSSALSISGKRFALILLTPRWPCPERVEYLKRRFHRQWDVGVERLDGQGQGEGPGLQMETEWWRLAVKKRRVLR